jgi:hypothetical protein
VIRVWRMGPFVLCLGPRRAEDSVPDPNDADRDSGEEEYAADEELAREVAPSGMTRVKTDNI